MSQAENLFEEVLAKAEQEYSVFLEGLKGKGFEETISHVYEIVTKQEFLNILRDNSGINLIGLKNTDLPLDTLYRDWLKRDVDYRGLLEENAARYLSHAAVKPEGWKKAKTGRDVHTVWER